MGKSEIFSKIVEVICSLLGTPEVWLIALGVFIVFIIASSLYIWKRSFAWALLFFSVFCLLFLSIILPIFSPDPGNMKFCINEFTQTLIADKFGIEELYTAGTGSTETKQNIRFPVYSSDVIKDDSYELLFRYARVPALLSSTIWISKENAPPPYGNRISGDRVFWKPSYLFIGSTEAIQYALMQKYLSKLFLFEFCVWLVISLAGYKYAYEEMYTAEKSLFTILMSLILMIWIFWGMLLTPPIYMNSYKSVIKNLRNEPFPARIGETNQTGTSVLSLANKEYKVFISKDNFLPTNYLRIDLDLFNYIYLAEKESDIIHSPEMTLKQVGEKLFIGKYKSYIRKSNFSTLMILSILAAQVFLMGYFARKYMRVKKNES